METLPPEVHLNILAYLPAKNINSFTRLNHYFYGLINRNWNVLPKCKASLILGESILTQEDHSFTVVTESEDIPLKFAHQHLISDRGNPAANGLQMAYYSFFINQPIEARTNSLFFKWLFNRVDLKYLEIIPGSGFEWLNRLIDEAINKTRFRCRQVIIMNSTISLKEVQRIWSFLPKLCNHQRNLGYEIQLYTQPKDAIEDILDNNVLNNFETWFSEVIVEYQGIEMLRTLFFLSSRLLHKNNALANLGNIIFRFRLKLAHHYDERDITFLNFYADRFLRLNLTVDITRDEMMDLVDLEKIGRIRRLIECKRNNNGKILKFKLARRAGAKGHVILRVEMN